jgi:hypothetical protein
MAQAQMAQAQMAQAQMAQAQMAQAQMAQAQMAQAQIAQAQMAQAQMARPQIAHKLTPADKMIHAVMKNPEFFIDACRQLFATIVGIGQHLIDSETDKHYVSLYLRHSDVIDVQDGDKTYSFKFHVLLYGIQLSQDFHHRFNIFREIGIDNPFAAAQVYFRTKGLFLANHSNPMLGSNLVIKLFRNIPPNVGQLWHGQNRIPYVKEDVVIEDPRCANVKHFYIEANPAFQHYLSNPESITQLIASRLHKAEAANAPEAAEAQEASV